MSGGGVIDWKVPCLRHLPPMLRRARLIAAREYRPGTVARHAILGGYWDHGSVVGRHRAEP
jgi:hypothetical protein